MAGIFTRSALKGIITGEGAEEVINNVMALYTRALEDGYVSKTVADEEKRNAAALAVDDFKKNVPAPDIKGSDDYKALEAEFSAYKTMQNARTAEDYKSVKPKFFETVYNMVDRADGAKPVSEQLAKIKTQFEEYFAEEDKTEKPQFGGATNGTPPSGDKDPSLLDMWGYSKKFNLGKDK